MRPEMISPLSRRELLGLHNPTKRELLAYVRNQVQIIAGNADVISTNSSRDPNHDAHVIASCARSFMAEIENLLKSNPNDGLGAGERHEDGPACAHCQRPIPEGELTETGAGQMHERCAENCESRGVFSHDHGDSRWPR
jgi:hypothetical protein